MNRWHRTARAALAGAAVVAAAGCTENIDGSAACPIVCKEETAQLQTEMLDTAVTLDASVVSQGSLGSEPAMLLSSRGDTLDSRVVFRFDNLPDSVRLTGKPVAAITGVDSARLIVRADSLGAKNAVQVTISVYDIDTTSAANDTAVAVLRTLFSPARLLATQTFAPGKFVDSVAIAVPNAFVLAKLQARQRIRLGLTISGTQSVSARIWSTEGALSGQAKDASSSSYRPALYMRVATADTSNVAATVGLVSLTPTNNGTVASNLRDLALLVRGTPAPPAGVVAVGGLPGRRTLFRFNIPSRIVDSSIVVRASLLLTQQASGSPDGTDTMSVQPALVVAGPTLTDTSRIAQVISTTITPLSALRTVPASAGVREVDIAPLFRVWAVRGDTLLPRSIVLFSSAEGTTPQQVWFYSSEATDPAVRPKLRITYTLRSRIGAP